MTTFKDVFVPIDQYGVGIADSHTLASSLSWVKKVELMKHQMVFENPFYPIIGQIVFNQNHTVKNILGFGDHAALIIQHNQKLSTTHGNIMENADLIYDGMIERVKHISVQLFNMPDIHDADRTLVPVLADSSEQGQSWMLFRFHMQPSLADAPESMSEDELEGWAIETTFEAIEPQLADDIRQEQEGAAPRVVHKYEPLSTEEDGVEIPLITGQFNA